MPQGMTYGMRQNKRYITALDEAGNSIVLASPELQYWDRGGYSLSRLYGLDTVPANICQNSDIQKYLSSNSQQNPTSVMNKELVIEGGVSFIQGDFGPSSISPWHRTISVDFVTVVEGTLELEVGDDAKDCTKLTLNRGVRPPIPESGVFWTGALY